MPRGDPDLCVSVSGRVYTYFHLCRVCSYICSCVYPPPAYLFLSFFLVGTV